MEENEMDITAKRFDAEWKAFQQRNKYHSVQETLDAITETIMLSREEISRYRNGKRTMTTETINIFSKLFGIRPEYLSGGDSYRTEADLMIAQKKKADIYSAIHNILILLGYADLHMDEGDYNNSFPSNTRAFLESLKDLEQEGVNLLCDVNNDNYIPLNQERYDALIQEIISFIRFKFEYLFGNNEALPIPDCITEDGLPLLHPHTEIELKDGNLFEFDIQYTPTALSERTQKKGT